MAAQQSKHALATALHLTFWPTSDTEDLFDAALERTLIQHFDSLVPSRVALIDKATEPVGDQPKTITVVMDGRPIERATDLISGTAAGPAVTLSSMTPYLFEIAEPSASPAR